MFCALAWTVSYSSKRYDLKFVDILLEKSSTVSSKVIFGRDILEDGDQVSFFYTENLTETQEIWSREKKIHTKAELHIWKQGLKIKTIWQLHHGANNTGLYFSFCTEILLWNSEPVIPNTTYTPIIYSHGGGHYCG